MSGPEQQAGGEAEDQPVEGRGPDQQPVAQEATEDQPVEQDAAEETDGPAEPERAEPETPEPRSDDEPEALPDTEEASFSAGSTASGEAAADASPAEADTPAAGPPPTARRRRGAAEITPSRREGGRRPRRDRPPADVEVRAQAKYVRTAPRKARLVVDHIRGKSVDDAIAILTHSPRGASRDVLKLLRSCVANAENNHELGADELQVGRVFVDEGPTLKRYRPRALGRATRIRKRTSHMTITLVPKE